MDPTKSYWMGQDIDDLPRETLIEIIHHLSKDLDSARDSHKQTCEMLTLVAKARTR